MTCYCLLLFFTYWICLCSNQCVLAQSFSCITIFSGEDHLDLTTSKSRSKSTCVLLFWHVFSLSLGSFLFFPQCLKEAILPNGSKLGRTGTLTADLTGFQSWKSLKIRVIKIIQDKCVSDLHHFVTPKNMHPQNPRVSDLLLAMIPNFHPNHSSLSTARGSSKQRWTSRSLLARLQETHLDMGYLFAEPPGTATEIKVAGATPTRWFGKGSMITTTLQTGT